MTVQLRISDACPHCGQQVLVQLAAVPPAPGDPGLIVPVIVDPTAAALHAAAPSADHPCPESETTL